MSAWPRIQNKDMDAHTTCLASDIDGYFVERGVHGGRGASGHGRSSVVPEVPPTRSGREVDLPLARAVVRHRRHQQPRPEQVLVVDADGMLIGREFEGQGAHGHGPSCAHVARQLEDVRLEHLRGSVRSLKGKARASGAHLRPQTNVLGQDGLRVGAESPNLIGSARPLRSLRAPLGVNDTTETRTKEDRTSKAKKG